MPLLSPSRFSHPAGARHSTCRVPFPSISTSPALLRVIFVPREPTGAASIQAPAPSQSPSLALARPRPSTARRSTSSVVVRTSSSTIKRTQFPIIQTAIQPTLTQDFARHQVSKQQLSHFHSSPVSPILPILNFNMVSQSVNKTNLHPSGVL